MIELVVFLVCMIAVNVSWGVYCIRLENEWSTECDKRDRAWQEQCAAIVAWYYTRLRARDGLGGSWEDDHADG